MATMVRRTRLSVMFILMLPVFFINALEPLLQIIVLRSPDHLTLQVAENSLEGLHDLTKGKQLYRRWWISL